MVSLVSILDESARAYPDKVALRFAGRSYSYAELKRRVDALAGALASFGVSKGDCVSVVSPNTNASIEVLFACARIGAVCARLNVRFSPQVISTLLERSEATVVFASADQLDALGPWGRDGGRSAVKVLVDVDGGEAKERFGALAYEGVLDSAKPYLETCDTEPDDPALLLYTSGTTGMPKGVLLSHGALMHRIETDIAEMRFAHDDILLCELPLFHVTFVSTLATLAVGGELVIAESHKPADIASDLVRYRATRTALVPYLMRGLAELVEQNGMSFNDLKLIIYGGEPVAPELLMRCQRALPCGYLQGYGMTETTAAITMLLPEHHLDPALLATAGTPVRGMELKIVDEDGRALPVGQCGEVFVKSDTLMSGYFRDPERTAEVFVDGWYRTGDIGHFDEDGFLTLVDRKDNMVITGGENVYPLEVARCIVRMDGIEDAVVMGVPDAHWGETLAAFAVRAPGSDVTEADIAQRCACELGGYKKPRIVRFVDGLARNASGKIPKEQLEKLKNLV
ncbi:class I adenylate-forming enzyme family protein [Raoultibacter phocaeensis]|uniref:class I adenylate-forming enzyme family protein n=1 Tax=Raoultibacter phocaeensis TaxID=2479841 RepID=UPI00111B70F0|nr:AMP-binding protein [Raoultibacter phocaeensis]